ARIDARPGNAIIPSDSDGAMRRVPYATQKLKSAGIVTAEVAEGRTIDRPSGGQPWIDYEGPTGTVPTYSYEAVLRGRVAPSTFAGKVVVGGATASAFQDLHKTSTGARLMSGAEIQANVIGTALRGFPLRSLWSGWTLLLIVLFALIAPVALLWLRAW